MSRWFVAKAWLGGVGVAGGLVGMAFDWPPLVYGAVALLAAAFVLRILERTPTRD